MRLVPALAAAALLIPGAALAHTGHGDVGSLARGFLHPLGGVDHLLAMVAVGLFAFRLGGRALWLVPAAFVGMMAAGGLLGFESVALPFVDIAIAFSVLALGLAVAWNKDMPTAAAMALVGFFAVFHGHAHGAELPENAGALGYAAGFLAATALLHAAGIAAASVASRAALVRAGGGAVALAGVALLAAVI
jgi:urease accessory protein